MPPPPVGLTRLGELVTWRWAVTVQRLQNTTDERPDGADAERSRRAFLRAAGLGGALVAFPSLFAACSSDVAAPTSLAPQALDTRGGDAHAHSAVVLNFHSDIGVLNYAYALEQLEAAFYTTLLYHPYAHMSDRERRLLADVRDHEIAHRDFLRAALGDQRIPALTPMLAAIDFTNRDAVLNAARTFEDLGVAAYNGAAKYLESDAYLTIAGKIVSVEARHASAIRDLLQPKSGSFAPKAFDDTFAPDVVLAAASAFIAEKITVVNASERATMTQHSTGHIGMNERDTNDASRPMNRRAALFTGARLSGAVAVGLRVASVPVALSVLSKQAFAQSGLPLAVIEVLNFALTLGYLGAEFYVTGVGTAGLIPVADRPIFTTIRDHEVAHVAYLKNALGAAAVMKPMFDFTAGNGSMKGPYTDVFSNYATFMAVAQAFEDTGVRAYKGQAPALKPYDDILTAALTIHSVEARHASEVRRLRGNFSEMTPNEGWITRNSTDIPRTAPVHAREENTIQGGVDVLSVTTVGRDEVTEAFDEPLTKQQVLAIVDPFIA